MQPNRRKVKKGSRLQGVHRLLMLSFKVIQRHRVCRKMVRLCTGSDSINTASFISRL
jgi:hypothetical protein